MLHAGLIKSYESMLCSPVIIQVHPMTLVCTGIIACCLWIIFIVTKPRPEFLKCFIPFPEQHLLLVVCNRLFTKSCNSQPVGRSDPVLRPEKGSHRTIFNGGSPSGLVWNAPVRWICTGLDTFGLMVCLHSRPSVRAGMLFKKNQKKNARGGI